MIDTTISSERATMQWADEEAIAECNRAIDLVPTNGSTIIPVEWAIAVANMKTSRISPMQLPWAQTTQSITIA